jgi:SAM-dependent methyltransferase
MSESAYVTDVPYARAFHDQTSPAMIRLVAAMNGFAPNVGDDFSYCDVGCGAGDTLVTLAAAWPKARFVGIDINAEHVAFARSLAERGGVDNVRVLERDFDAPDEGEIGALDFVVMHGLASWIAADKRAAALAFAARHLKPGGLFYVSYNALPGWAALEPMRHAMREATASTPGTTLDRARVAMQFLQRLLDAKAPYLAQHAVAYSMLDVMQRAGPSYVAHEWFHDHWSPLRFADLARACASHDLTYVGQAPLYFAFRDLSLPTALKEMAKGIDDRIAYESFKDFSLNETFRCDVYVKSRTPSRDDARAWLASTAFGTLAPSPLVRREIQLPHYKLQLAGPLYDALLEALATRAASANDLAKLPALAHFGVARIVDAIQSMTLGGQVMPFVSPVSEMSTNASTKTVGALRLTLPAHAGVIDEALTRRIPIALPSRVLGTGLALSLLNALSLHLLTRVEEGERAAWIRSFVERTPLKMAVADRAVTDKDELTRVVEAEHLRFAAAWPDKLVELGVLTRA